MAVGVEDAVRLAADVLEGYADDEQRTNGCGQDSGPVVLAATLLTVDEAYTSLAHAVLGRWLDELPDAVSGIGPFGGLGGLLAGLRAARTFAPSIDRPYSAVCVRTEEWLSQLDWRTSAVRWSDYDLFTGPAGVVVAGLARHAPSRMVEPAVRHLVRLCADSSFERFRAGDEIDPRSSFNVGRINVGLGHGLTGVARALQDAMVAGDDGGDCRDALRRVCDWLATESFVDERGLLTWPLVGSDGASSPAGYDRRQAWCYGTPGTAWVLWDASLALDDTVLRDLATAAFVSFCRVFDEAVYVDDGPASEALALCHGVAGTLGVSDAFACHAQLEEARSLRARLTSHLLDRREEILDLGLADMSMLNGSSGIAALLLTSHGGGRDWLPQIALR